MKSRVTFSLAGLRRGLARHRGLVLGLLAAVSFYSLGGEQALQAAQVAHERSQQAWQASLLASGVAPERLPAAEPMPLVASVQRVSSRVSSGVELSGKWLLQSGEQLASLVGEKVAALRAEDAAPRATVGVRRAAAPAPRPGTRIQLPREPELTDDEEPARGPARARLAT
ncbi:MAG TPA: hypothetical protein VN811_05280, partial [Thermoanaerobaculia bacterium]|nr:hypothetical protein [Thermoanaerobaculia bacterium]